MKKPRWALWLCGWVLAMAAIAFGSDIWREADWWLYEKTSSRQAPPWPTDLMVIDVPWAEVPVFRARLTDLARLLAAQPLAVPRAVVFDVKFEARNEGLAELMAALRALQGAGTKLYAVVDPRHPSSGLPWPGFMAEHARPLYEGVLDGLGHTAFEQHGRVVKYEPRLALGEGVALTSVVIKVAEAHFSRPLNAPDKPILLRLGTAEPMRAHAWRFEHNKLNALAGNNTPDFRQRIVVVGSLREDVTPGALASGPEHLAWALAARAATADVAEARLLANVPLLVAATFLLAGLAVVLAWWVSRRAGESRWRVMWMCATAFLVPLSVLLAGVAALRGAGLVLAQVALPALGVVLAVLFCALFSWRYRLWAAVAGHKPQADLAYDVFVSYSRSDPAHVQWVRDQIVAPLRAMTHPQGRTLRVFFDTHEIKPGDNWFERLLNAVGNSRCFLPVYSADYHAKHFCNYELTGAVRRQIQKTMEIVPVRCAGAPVPKAAEGVQFVSAEDPAFMRQVAAKLDDVWRGDLRRGVSAQDGRAGSDGLQNEGAVKH